MDVDENVRHGVMLTQHMWSELEAIEAAGVSCPLSRHIRGIEKDAFIAPILNAGAHVAGLGVRGAGAVGQGVRRFGGAIVHAGEAAAKGVSAGGAGAKNYLESAVSDARSTYHAAANGVDMAAQRSAGAGRLASSSAADRLANLSGKAAPPGPRRAPPARTVVRPATTPPAPTPAAAPAAAPIKRARPAPVPAPAAPPTTPAAPAPAEPKSGLGKKLGLAGAGVLAGGGALYALNRRGEQEKAAGVEGDLSASLSRWQKEKRASPQQDDSQAAGDMVVDHVSPVNELVGVRAEPRPNGARGIPVLAPPPGYIFDPVLSALAPNMEDPGWVGEEEAMTQRTSAVVQNAAQQGQQPPVGGAAAGAQPLAATTGAPAQKPGMPGAPGGGGAPKTPGGVAGAPPKAKAAVSKAPS